MVQKPTRSASSSSSSSGVNYETLPIDYAAILSQVILHILFFGALLSLQITVKTLALTVVLYAISAFSISAGYHRLYAHRSFSAITPVRLFVLIFGAGAGLGSLFDWVLLHRAHHKFVDTEKDPFNIKKGFFHAHLGWRFRKMAEAEQKLQTDEGIDMIDVQKDAFAGVLSYWYPVLFLLVGIALPAAIASYWDDILGGIFFAGIGRIVIMQHAFNSIQSVGHTHGTQSYTDSISARSVFWLSFFTMGEGDQDFHHAFPGDYRISHTLHDPVKIIIKLLSLCGVVYDLKKAKRVDIRSRRLAFRQELVDRKRAGLNFGPEEEVLPFMTWKDVDERQAQGAKLIVVDGLVHDVQHFMMEHPGGVKILRSRLGKDTTLAFNGALYCHSKSARNILSTLRIGRLVKDDIEARVKKDHFRNEDE